MAFCINCGQELMEGAKFCAHCGKAVDNNSTSQRRAVYDGELHKCPNCGELINSFTTVCPTCNYEFRGTKATSIVKEFADKLEQIEATREIKKKGSFVTNAKELTKTDEQRINLIRSFVIPNTKEDIYEFMILASSNINTKWWLEGDMSTTAQEAESNAWLAKFEQAYQKAEFMFGNDPSFIHWRNMYNQKIAATKKKKWELPLIMIGSIVGVMLMMLFLVLIAGN